MLGGELIGTTLAPLLIGGGRGARDNELHLCLTSEDMCK